MKITTLKTKILILLITLIASCTDDKNYNIGDFKQGGVVFWVDDSGNHGLVCAKSDQYGGKGVRWYGGTSGLTYANGYVPFSGESNTLLIISSLESIGIDGSTYAALICNKLHIHEGGITYGDWYLPSLNELQLMYQNRSIINETSVENGGTEFTNDYYWSSTEHGHEAAWCTAFNNGNSSTISKGWEFKVRAIRSF